MINDCSSGMPSTNHNFKRLRMAARVSVHICGVTKPTTLLVAQLSPHATGGDNSAHHLREATKGCTWRGLRELWPSWQETPGASCPRLCDAGLEKHRPLTASPCARVLNSISDVSVIPFGLLSQSYLHVHVKLLGNAQWDVGRVRREWQLAQAPVSRMAQKPCELSLLLRERCHRANTRHVALAFFFGAF